MTHNITTTRIHAIITGLVQGVGFRYYTTTQARQYGITGWTHNRHDGTVEIEAQGPTDQLEQFTKQLRKGPRWSNVEHITTTEIPALANERAFIVK
ncbi:acylphosphatase [Bifidobacterium sp. SMB2]|uniref:acylphosphatase n=1 Tax=Bifidobacterium saimiriisciurei TaxID=2661627 RepID=A0ABX0C8W7_9BIFI|nr:MULTISPECIES: acylphosphatase [Bifidobacterium]NEG96879.1 acylphosphatase [Bifidobacterium sp. SMB2]NEH11591.1 acylphosphatase [Bifidobacterium saimiriisciurei]